jgi:ABC-2 type transport system permease protein
VTEIAIAGGAPPGPGRAWAATVALLRREIVRFLRERHRVFGALVQPLMLWGFFGAGLRASFRPPAGGGATSYAEYFFPGTVVLIVLFTAIFSTISLIEDRREGFLQGVLVAPIPRASLVLGKVLGGTALALGQGVLVLLLAPLAGIPLGAAALAGAILVLLAVAFGLTALSFCIAWRMDSTQGFHAVMTVLLLPLWLLSGAFFPAAGAPAWLRWLMACDPLTYGMAAFRSALYGGALPPAPGLPPPGPSIAATLLFGAACFAGALALASRAAARPSA